MRHKWMAMLVVMVTTLTTAQEALKQYDGLKAQAATWATLRLWTGILGAYAPPDAPLSAQQTTCHHSDASEQPQQPYAPALARANKIQSVKVHKQESSSPAPRVEVLALDDDHHNDSVEALNDIQEVALLNDADGVRTDERVVTPADVRVDLIRNSMREVRLVRPDNPAAPLAADAEHEAAMRQTRAATRAAEAQKARAIKRALKALHLQLDKAARQELSRAKAEVEIELPQAVVHTALDVANSINSGGGCAGE